MPILGLPEPIFLHKCRLGLFVRDADYAALLQDIETVRHAVATGPLSAVAQKNQ